MTKAAETEEEHEVRKGADDAEKAETDREMPQLMDKKKKKKKTKKMKKTTDGEEAQADVGTSGGK